MSQILYRAGYKYQLAKDYTIQTVIRPLQDVVTPFILITVDGLLTVKTGYAWDGPSGPTVDTKNFMRGSLVHDALYQLMRSRLIDCGWREKADEELRRICMEDGMSWLRAWWVFKGVRFGGEGSAEWQDELILLAPSILLIILLGMALSGCSTVNCTINGDNNYVRIEVPKTVTTSPALTTGDNSIPASLMP